MKLRYLLTVALTMLLFARGVSQAQPAPPREEKKQTTDKPEEESHFVVKAGQEIAVDSLLEHIGKMTGKAIIPSPNTQGRRVRFISSFSANYAILDAVLKVNGITLEHKEIEGTQMIKALIDRDMRQEKYGATPVIWIKDDSDLTKLPKDNELLTAIFELKYADPAIVARTFTNRFVDRQGPGVIEAVQGQPVVIARDLCREIRYYAELMRAIDVMPKSVEMRVYALKHAVASDVAQYLQQLAQGGRITGQRRGATPIKTGLEAQFVADIRTNKLIVLTFPENFEQIEQVIKELDEELPEGTGNIHIYQLKHTDAQKLAAALQSILSGQARPRTTARRGQLPAQLQTIPSRVVAEDQTNSLIIEAEKQAYEEIIRIVKQLDVRRPQVLIEAAIIEVSANSTTNMGIELASVDITGTGFRMAAGSIFGLSAPVDESDLTQGKQPIPGLGAMALVYKDQFNRIPFLLQMLRTNSDVNVISSPRILTNDNEKGEIKITDQVATVTYIDPQTGPSRQQFGSYQEAGVTLTITPHISTDNYLRLEIQLKIEQFTAPPVAGSTAPPPKTSREINGMVTVPDREIIVIGGLSSEEEAETVNKVPILGDIPIFGALFRSTVVTKRKTNLYVFLTPHIISDERFDSLKKISRRQQDAARLAGGNVDAASQILQDLPAYYAKRRSRAHIELSDTLQDLFGRDFEKVFVIEDPQIKEFYGK